MRRRSALALAALTAWSLGTAGCGGGGSSAPVICIMSEFRTREDGVPGLARVYNPAYANADYKDIGSTAEAGIAGGQCAAGEVFTTDSAIAVHGLLVLDDDRHLFPPDSVGLVVRGPVLRRRRPSLRRAAGGRTARGAGDRPQRRAGDSRLAGAADQGDGRGHAGHRGRSEHPAPREDSALPPDRSGPQVS